jgi:hypothetical protein
MRTVPKEPLMKKLVLLALLIAPCTVAITQAAAPVPDTSTVHGLYKACTDPPPGALQLYCIGYIGGVADMMMVAKADANKTHSPSGLAYCSEAPITREQTIQAFKNFHDQHPEYWNLQSIVGIMVALQQTWPCKDAQPQ